MNMKIIGLANGANAERASVTPNRMHRVGASRDATGMGSASVIHRITVATTTARKWCASTVIVPLIGVNRSRMNASGAKIRPNCCRR